MESTACDRVDTLDCVVVVVTRRVLKQLLDLLIVRNSLILAFATDGGKCTICCIPCMLGPMTLLDFLDEILQKFLNFFVVFGAIDERAAVVKTFAVGLAEETVRLERFAHGFCLDELVQTGRCH